MISRPLYGLLLVTLLGTIASQLYLPANDPAESEGVVLSNQAHQQAEQGLSLAIHRSTSTGAKDLFASQLPPPPPKPIVVAPPPPPPEPPRAPPLPYEYLGLMEEDGVVSIYLKRGENTVITHAGDKLDETYLVTRLDARGVHLTYLPLQQEQVIPLGH